MTRPPEPGLLGKIVDAATMSFIRLGYRGCRMERVAERAGISVGTIYRYVRNKEALFELVVASAFGEAAPNGGAFPIRGRRNLDFVDELWSRLLATHPIRRLQEALETVPPPDPAGEFESIVRDLYRWQRRYWRAIMLIERCAREWPELELLYYRQFRRDALETGARYLEQRAEAGALRAAPDPALAARFVAETVAFFAMHRNTAPDSDGMDEAGVEETVVTLIRNAFELQGAPVVLTQSGSGPGKARHRRSDRRAP